MREIRIKPFGALSSFAIGRRGENDITEVFFDFSSWRNEFGAGVCSLLVKRPTDANAYPVVLTQGENTAEWLVSSTDTAYQGHGFAEFSYTVDEKIVKSIVFNISILDDIGEPSENPPDPYQTWIDTLTDLGAETLHNAQEASQSADDALAAKVAAETAQGKAEDAQEAAEDAKGAAEAAAQILESPTADAETLSAGSNATASYLDGNFHFGIPKGEVGNTGAVFTPSVSEQGVISWTNDGGLENPASVDIAAAVEGAFVVNVSGTDPVIVGESNHRYICGEVATISITPPQNGIIDVVFTSGTSLAVLTLPNTVMMPDWFEVETNRIYEINIADGVYGSVMSWALT